MGHQPIFRAINFNRDKRTGFCKPVSGAKRRPVGPGGHRDQVLH